MEAGEGREIIHLSRHCHHQNHSCLKMGSDESQFNVSLIVRDKVRRQCPQTTTFFEERALYLTLHCHHLRMILRCQPF